MTRARGEYWRLAFQGNLHQVPPEDYELIAGLMRQAQTGEQAGIRG
ncbi:MAG TPA: hypothetical protein VFT91_00720 [Dehalococcoidia bacterium]|nr:hypothetical protein [Dehalococcoidia bacterium]